MYTFQAAAYAIQVKPLAESFSAVSRCACWLLSDRCCSVCSVDQQQLTHITIVLLAASAFDQLQDFGLNPG
jgi:hypothetical protein